MAKKYIYRQDPGHGWVQVSQFELQTLGIADKISSCSYQRGETCYLEEDCDFGVWYKAYHTFHGDYPLLEAVVYEEECFIRKLPRYKYLKMWKFLEAESQLQFWVPLGTFVLLVFAAVC